MVGFTLVSRSYYYLRRRSPGPPFPPDYRQAGERGAIMGITPKVPKSRNLEALRANTTYAAFLAKSQDRGNPYLSRGVPPEGRKPNRAFCAVLPCWTVCVATCVPNLALMTAYHGFTSNL